MSRLLLDGLTRRFGSVTAVDRVSLDVPDGEFLALLGPSGCGKTTLLRMIAGLVAPSSGRILVDDEDITHQPPKRRNLAMVFQSYALYPHLSVAANIGFPLRTRRMPRAVVRRRVNEVAEQLELTELLRRRPRELSGGQRQRVALGRSLVREPRAFLMDEPLSNLDARLRASTRAELTQLHRRLGATFVYVTHDQVEAMAMATRVAVLNKGRLEQIGTPTEVYDEPASVFVAGFLGSPPMNLLPARVESIAGQLRVVGRDAEAPLWAGEVEATDVLLGVRPEHLRPVGADGDVRAADSGRRAHADGSETAVFRGTVTAVENLGSEEVAHCQVGDGTLAVRGARPLGLRPGAAVTLRATAAHIHLFDPTSGRRLVWRDEPAESASALPSDRPVPAAAAAPEEAALPASR